MAGAISTPRLNAADSSQAKVEMARKSSTVSELDVDSMIKFVYSQLQPCIEKTSDEMLSREAYAIAKTLCTRFTMCSEGSTIANMIRNIASYDYEHVPIDDSGTAKMIDSVCRKVLYNLDNECWNNKGLVYYNTRDFKPSSEDLKKYDWHLAYMSDNFSFWELKQKQTMRRHNTVKLS